MALMNCKQCGRLFNRVAKDICPDCLKTESDDFLKVTEFLRKNRGASPTDVHAATEVELEIIYRFIREGRLIAENLPSMSYPCDRCGKPTQLGRFCKPCTDELKTGFGGVVDQSAGAQEEKPSTGKGFHMKDRLDRR